MSKELMREMLEFLEGGDFAYPTKLATDLREELAKPDFWEGYVPEPVKPAQQALDKKAENARELGLDYEPAQPRAWFTIDELNAWADKKLKENPQWAEQSAQRTWVGLTEEEIEQSCVPLGAAMLSFTEVARAIEAKLKEKNT
jgi:hypothetical protein